MTKKKDAQKLAQWALSQIASKTKKTNKKGSSADKDLAALENAFGSLEVKSN